AAVVVSASTEPEAFGRVAVEAQAMGRPIIASAHGGSLETVEDQKTGYLYPPQDPKALAEVIDAALSLDPSARAHMGMAGRARVRSRFTVEAMQRSTLAVYDRIMEARG
ncbi:MAG: glycosyltransferase, partial [Pseudomonadota bacterium]